MSQAETCECGVQQSGLLPNPRVAGVEEVKGGERVGVYYCLPLSVGGVQVCEGLMDGIKLGSKYVNIRGQPPSPAEGRVRIIQCRCSGGW